MKKWIAAVLAVFMLAGCSNDSSGSKIEDYNEYTYENLTLLIPKELNMEEAELDEYDWVLDGDKLAVFTNRFMKSDLKEQGFENAEQVFQEVFPDQEYEISNGYRYFLYTNTGDDGMEYRYLYALLEDNVYYWDFNLAVLPGDDAQADDDLLVGVMQRLVLKN